MSTSLHQIRAFIAVDVGPEVRAILRPVFEKLRKVSHKVRWVPEQNWHLTAKFLGDVDGQQITKIAEAMQEEAAQHTAFDLEFRGIKPFPPNREPRIIALDVESGTEALAAFHKGLDQRMRAFGVASEKRHFLAHLTLGRIKGTSNTPRFWDLIQRNAETDFGIAHISEASLYQSHLRPEGAEYVPLAQAEFKHQ